MSNDDLSSKSKTKPRDWGKPWVTTFDILNGFLADGVAALGVVLLAQVVYRVVEYVEGTNENDFTIAGVKLNSAYFVFYGDFVVIGAVVAILAFKLVKRLIRDEG
ncbi:MAG: hypothetical protein ACREDT_03255 [Methylocella sp.]